MADAVNFGDDGFPQKDERPLLALSESITASRASLPLRRDESPPDESPARPSRSGGGSSPGAGRDEFTGALQPLQVKIPADLIQSLKLHAISSGQTMSEMVLECLTSKATIGKAWISTRGKRAA
jgi:hypothetical protein